MFLFSAHFNDFFKGFDYDSCANRRPNFCYPSLSKPPQQMYGRYNMNQCVTSFGNCGGVTATSV